jgi:hypothetical protein
LRHPVSYAAMPGDEATNFGEVAPCAAGFRQAKPHSQALQGKTTTPAISLWSTEQWGELALIAFSPPGFHKPSGG